MKTVLQLLILIAVVILCTSCLKKKRNVVWLNRSTILDTTLISHDWNRGVYGINDSIILTAGLEPFDKKFCETIPLRYKPLIDPDNLYACTLADLYPPFRIYKPTVSDTLIVIMENGTVAFFRIPDLDEKSDW